MLPLTPGWPVCHRPRRSPPPHAGNIYSWTTLGAGSAATGSPTPDAGDGRAPCGGFLARTSVRPPPTGLTETAVPVISRLSRPNTRSLVRTKKPSSPAARTTPPTGSGLYRPSRQQPEPRGDSPLHQFNIRTLRLHIERLINGRGRSRNSGGATMRRQHMRLFASTTAALAHSAGSPRHRRGQYDPEGSPRPPLRSVPLCHRPRLTDGPGPPHGPPD